LVLLRADHAAHHGDAHVAPRCAQLLEPPELPVRALFRVLADGAGVEHHQVGVIGGIRRDQPGAVEPGRELARVRDVHLTADGPDVVLHRGAGILAVLVAPASPGTPRANRVGAKAASAASQRPLTIPSATSAPVSGPSRMPLRKCPVAATRPSAPGTGPMIGRPSSLPGRRPAHSKRTCAAPSCGTRAAAVARMRRRPSRVVRRRKPTRSTVDPANTSPFARGTR